MKTKWLKSAIIIGIATIMTVGLCAGGKYEEDIGWENLSNALARENVYSVISAIFCFGLIVRSAVCANDEFCAVMQL